jgi:hypothetical protein
MLDVPCSSVARIAGRMARSTGTGVWWRIAGWQEEGSSSGRCSTSGRSMIVSARRGARRWRSSRMNHPGRRRWPSSPRIARSTTERSCKSVSGTYSCVGPGSGWLACRLYEQLGLDEFWAERLPPSRKGTRWDLVVQALCCYRLIDPGSEWRLNPKFPSQSRSIHLILVEYLSKLTSRY